MMRATGVPVLEFRSVAKSYTRKGRTVRGLAPLTFSLPPGELVALVGPNGCGKTTALKIAATLVDPTSGCPLVLGRSVSSSRPAARSATGVMLAPLRSFYWRLTARQNLSFFAAMQGLGPLEAARRVRGLADELRLSEHLATAARRLSAGTLARLAFARSLLHDPALLLLDEPFSSMDDESSELVWASIERRARGGLAALVASHDVAHISRCGRQVAVGPCI